MAATIAANAPIAVRACKKAINEGLDVDMDAALVIEENLFGSCFKSADQIEGMAAFLEKRKHEPYQNK
jgi:enoyl-CoA hydratase